MEDVDALEVLLLLKNENKTKTRRLPIILMIQKQNLWTSRKVNVRDYCIWDMFIGWFMIQNISGNALLDQLSKWLAWVD